MLNGQNVISASKTLGASDKGTSLLIVTSGITITLPASGFKSGEGVMMVNVSGDSVTLTCEHGGDFGSTLPNGASIIVICDGGPGGAGTSSGFWRQYCYSTSRL